MRKRGSCLCGYESRSDYVSSHKKKCKAFSIISKLQDERIELKKRCATWESIQNSNLVALKNENEELKKELKTKTESLHEELHQKDNEIQKLLKRSKSSSVSSSDVIILGLRSELAQARKGIILKKERIAAVENYE